MPFKLLPLLFSFGLESTTLNGPVGLARTSENWISASAEFQAKAGASQQYRFKGRFLGEGLSGYSGSIPFNHSGSPQFIDDQELFLEARAQAFKFSAGSRVLRWGISDFYDPLDQINSRRFERPLKTQKRGERMLYAEWRGLHASIESFVIPEKKPAILPSVTSAWLPRKIYTPSILETDFVLPTQLEYRYRDSESRDDGLKWNYGTKIKFQANTTEFSMQYDEGSASLPALRPSFTGSVVSISPRLIIAADPLIELTEIQYRERRWGGSVVQSLPYQFLLRAQGAKSEPMFRGRELARDRSDFTLAVEKNVGLGAIGQATFLIQGFKNFLAKESTTNDLSSFSNVFDNAAVLALRVSTSESTAVSLGFLSTFSGLGGTITSATLTHSITSSLMLEADWNLFDGPSGSALDAYNANDGGSLKLSYAF